MSIRAWNTWRTAIVKITNDNGDSGSGVLVCHRIHEVADHLRFFCVSAAHVISHPIKSLSTTHSFIVHHNRVQRQPLESASFEVLMYCADGKPQYRKHPKCDLVAVELNRQVIIERELGSADGTDMVTRARYEHEQLAPGDDVLVMGYPAGIFVASSNEPVVSQGRLGTPVFEPVSMPTGPDHAHVEAEAFLIDASIMQGSSGSAIILAPRAGRPQLDRIMMPPAPPFLLGIIDAEITRSSLLPTSRTEITGLASAFSTVAIKQTIDLFALDFDLEEASG